MRDFKIRKVTEYLDKPKFDVEIEFLDNGDRETSVWPIGQGWELDVDGLPKYVHELQKRIYQRYQRLNNKIGDVKTAEGKDISFKDYKKEVKKPRRKRK